MKKIDFLYIGPPKSGSSWLYHQLAKSKDIDIPRAKDLYYFDKFFEKGNKWYFSFFDWKSERLKGELSHDYLYSLEALRRIKEHNKDIKLIGVFRDPVGRALSHYKFSRKHGNVDSSLFEACQENPNIVECSRYEKYLPLWQTEFDDKQILLIFFDEIANDPVSVIKKIESFLGISIPKEGNVDEKVNPSGVSRSVIVAKIAKRAALILRSLGLANVLGWLKSNKVIGKVLYKKGGYEISPGDKRWLEHELKVSNDFFRDIRFN